MRIGNGVKKYTIAISLCQGTRVKCLVSQIAFYWLEAETVKASLIRISKWSYTVLLTKNGTVLNLLISIDTFAGWEGNIFFSMEDLNTSSLTCQLTSFS